MTPPINIDGTNENYSSVTIDGQTVEQITIDGQDVLSTIPDSGIARWNFEDDTDTTTILDGFNGFNGTNSGVTYSTDSKVDSLAGEYDGNSFFTTNDWAGGLSAASFGGYIKETSGNNRPRIVSAENNRFRVFINFANNEGYQFSINGSTIGEGNTSYTVGNYEFVTAVYDKTGLGDGNTAKIYKGDANEIAAGSPSTADVNSSNDIEYGQRHGSTGDRWVGLHDDLRAYNKALSPTEISNWFNTGSI